MVIIDIANVRGHKKVVMDAALNQKLDGLIASFQTFESRLSSIEANVSKTSSDLSNGHPPVQELTEEGGSGDNRGAAQGSGTAHQQVYLESTESSIEPSTDALQAKFKSIKDSLQKVRLPEGFKTDTALRGIGRQHIASARLINSSSDYAETLFKFILTLQEDSPLKAEDIDTLVTVVSAHIKYLQAEKGVCYVNAKFGENVGTMFREFKSHASAFSSNDIQTLERVVQLASAYNNNRGASQRGRGRGYRGNGYQGYDGGYSRGGYRGQGNRYQWNRGGFQNRGNRSGGNSWNDSENSNEQG